MALLLLWEVDHSQTWPSPASSRPHILTSFTRRLTQQIAQDGELSAWCTPKLLLRPLVPGVPESRHLSLPVRVMRPVPPEPQGWYEEFVRRWRAYLGTLACPRGVAVLSAATVGVSMEMESDCDSARSSEPTKARRTHSHSPQAEQRKRQRTAPPARPQGGAKNASGPLKKRDAKKNAKKSK